MRRIDNFADQMNDVVTLELSGGRRVVVDGHAYRALGKAGIARELGIEPSTKRLNVERCGEIVGTLPADFDPLERRCYT